jgi:hypothetical protein
MAACLASVHACTWPGHGGSVTVRHLASTLSADHPHILILSAPRPSLTCFLLLVKQPSTPRHRLCSPHRSPLPPLHPTLTPLSAQVTSLSRSTVLMQRFYLEPAAVRSPRSHPTLCTISIEGASSTATNYGHRPPSVSPP